MKSGTDSAESPPPSIEVLPATPEQEPVLANLMELYSYDFSEVLPLQLQPDGRFGAPKLSQYWRDENRQPFLVTVDRHLAGFVLVARGSRISGDPAVWDMAEFFVVRGHRKRGVGAAVARDIWRRFPGAWEVRVIDNNLPARAFWRAAIDRFADSGVEEKWMELHGQRWQVFSFVSPG